MEPNDTINVVFSTHMKVSSFCAAWSNDANNQGPTDVIVNLSQASNSSHATIDLSSQLANTCGTALTFHFGSIDVATTGYDGNGNRSNNFASTVSYNATSNTLTFTLGTQSGGGTPSTVTTATAVIYTPDAAIKNSAGTAITGTASSNVEQF